MLTKLQQPTAPKNKQPNNPIKIQTQINPKQQTTSKQQINWQTSINTKLNQQPTRNKQKPNHESSTTPKNSNFNQNQIQQTN